MQLIILSIVTGFIGTAIYGFWLQGREPQIKHSLALTKRSFLRKRRVRAYVSAIRGEFDVESSKRAVTIQIELTLVFIAVLFVLSANFENMKRDTVRSLAIADEWLVAKGELPKRTPEPAVHETVAIKARLEGHVQQLDRAFHALLFVAIPILTLQYLWLLWIKLPYVQRRSAFLVRLERLRRILPVACDREELVEILLLERRTSNEQSLRDFANALIRIGAKHGLQEFVSEFELWPQES